MHYTTSCNTQSIAPKDGRDHRPKHVELIGIINKLLFLHLVGVYIIYINDARSNKYQIVPYYLFMVPYKFYENIAFFQTEIRRLVLIMETLFNRAVGSFFLRVI